MKWQNLTNRIIGPLVAVLVFANMWPVGALAAQEDPRPPLLLTKCWESISDDGVKHLSASDNDSIFLATRTGGKVELIETRTGKRVWRSEFGGDVVSAPVVDMNSVFLRTNSSVETGKIPTTTLRAISISTGVPVWTASLPYSEQGYLAEAGSNLIIINLDGYVSAQNKSVGGSLWTFSAGAKLSGTPRVNENEVILPLESSEIVVLSAHNGAISFRLKTVQAPSAIVRVDEKTIIWGDSKGTIYSTELPSGAIRWKFKNGGSVSGIIGTKAGTLVTSYDNFVYLMSPGGRVIWKRRLSGRVISEPVVDDTFAMVAILGESGVSFIDLETGKILNKIVDGDEYGMAGPIRTANSLIFGNSEGLFSYSSADCLRK
jgi:outer membrane protein assembly factor BamB